MPKLTYYEEKVHPDRSQKNVGHILFVVVECIFSEPKGIREYRMNEDQKQVSTNTEQPLKFAPWKDEFLRRVAVFKEKLAARQSQQK